MSKLAARSACTVDLSVKESVLQFNPQGRVDVEG